MSDPLQILSFNVVSVYQKLHSGRSNGGEALFDSQRRLRLARIRSLTTANSRDFVLLRTVELH
jgi:hypothetical protein